MIPVQEIRQKHGSPVTHDHKTEKTIALPGKTVSVTGETLRQGAVKSRHGEAERSRGL